MATATTTYELAVDRLLKAALEAAEEELGGELTDWKLTFEGPAHVVVQAWHGTRFGTFAGRLDPADHTVHTESYGMRSSSDPEAQAADGLTPVPVTGAQTEAVVRALDQWLETADRNDEDGIAEREHVRTFRVSLGRRSVAAQEARHDAETLFQLLGDANANDEQVRDLAGQLAAFVHPRARRRFTRD